MLQGIGLIGTILIGTTVCIFYQGNRHKTKQLKRESQTYTNTYFVDRYFDHKYFKRKLLKLKDHKLIYYSGKYNKKVINLYQVQSIHVKGFKLIIKTKTNKKIKIPLGFQHQSYIYAILKHHRPNESRTAITTRHA